MSRLFLCEKPSQARDIAAVLGSPKRADAWIETNGGRVTWAIGHLLELLMPADYNPDFKNWNLAHLPIIPPSFKVKPVQRTASHLKLVSKAFKEATEVVIATDADREGEMIAREILDHVGYRGKIVRLWLSALDEASIRKALSALKTDEETLPLYHAAMARSRADWLVGINYSRALTKLANPFGRGTQLNIGRVQTPTLALVVRRDLEIEKFQSRDYFTLTAGVVARCGESVALHYRPEGNERIFDRDVADKLVERCNAFSGPLKVDAKPMKTPPPKLFSLSGFQKAANRAFGWGAQKSLDVAQKLYEEHKATTYPRSDCEFLPEEQVGDAATIMGNLADLFPQAIADNPTPVIRKTVFNTAKVTAHHAIIPTVGKPDLARMNTEEQAAFKLIAAHYLAALLPDYEYTQTKISLAAAVEFSDVGQTPMKVGWRIVFGAGGGSDRTLPAIPDGDEGTIQTIEVVGNKTKPPDRYTEGMLIDDMKAVAKYVQDPAKKAKLKETSGIGTEATRANIIEKLFSTGYLEKTKEGRKAIILSTANGRNLIGIVDKLLPALADPAETAVWEDALEAIAEGRNSTDGFVGNISSQLGEQVKMLIANREQIAVSKTLDVLCPKSGEPVKEYATAYNFPGFPTIAFNREFVGRTMSVEDYVGILEAFTGGNSTPQKFEGFRSEAGKTFSAGVRFNPDRIYNERPAPGVELVFEEGVRGSATEEVDPRGGEQVRDLGDSWFFPGSKCYFRKALFGRMFSLEEAVSVVGADEGIVFDDLLAKKNLSKYSARLFYCGKVKKTGKPGIEIDIPSA